MKITVHVRASEFVTRTYEIDCGQGNQFISWLATTACLRFGQDHYPHGNYVPQLLMGGVFDEDNLNTPHPR